MTIHTRLTVELAERSYPIVIGSGLLGGGYDLAPHIRGSDCLIVTNETVGPLYLDLLSACLGEVSYNVVELPDGEAHKTLESFSLIMDGLVAAGANRDTTVIALGGGVVGDVAGFAAASYMRGVRFIQVPTTLLSQVDSSVGGKTGVNHPGGKNLIGAFHQPELVLIDTDTLNTLEDRELSAGMAEVIKHGAIADLDYFDWLEQNIEPLMQREPAALAAAVARSCEIKAEVVAEDEREQGRRAILNFGHTFGHAIENTVGYGEWLHGEAVGAGMVMAAQLSAIPGDQQARLRALIEAANLPVTATTISAEALRSAMQLDKKVLAKRLRFILLETLGSAFVSDDVDERDLGVVLEARGALSS